MVGIFIAEVTEEEWFELGQDFQEGVCPVADWLDLFVVPSICPVVENSKLEKASHEDKLAGMEEREDEHVGDEYDSNERAQLPGKTKPHMTFG